MAFLVFIMWVVLLTSGELAAGAILTPFLVLLLWRARAFEPRTQAWLDGIVRRVDEFLERVVR